jgi:hypothetical protein
MEKPTDVRVDELRVDDVLVHPRHGRRLRIFDIVAPGVGLLEILAEDGNPKLLTTKYLWPVNGRTLALRPGRCDEPVCELHAREVSEDRFYCRAHWNAWKDVT